MSRKPPYFTATLAKGLDVLAALAELDEIGLSELARRLGVSGPTLFRILATLTAEGYVEKSAEGRYRLTLKLWELGARRVGRLAVRDVARPEIERLVEELGEAAHLGVLEGDGVVIVEKLDCRQPVRVETYVGQRAPAHCSAIGKAILAFSREELLTPFLAGKLKRYSPTTVATPAAFRRELARIRERGFATNREEWRPGVCAVAVPIRRGEEAVAALSLTMPTARFADAAVEKRFAPALKRAGEVIARRLI